MSKTLLVAGGSHSDIPIIKAARNYGYRVFTSGNNADDLGHRFSDASYLEDFSDQEAMLSLAKRLNIDAICPSANDFSMITASYVAEKLGLPGYDSYKTTTQLHHKDTFRRLAKDIGLKTPKSASFNTPKILHDDISGLKLPLIIKPVDLTGGKGISRVDRIEEIPYATQLAYESSRAKRIIIEEYFTGSLHSCSFIIKDRKIIFEFSDNEFSYINPFTVSTSTSPASIPPEISKTIKQNTERLANNLKLQDGLIHVQFLSNNKTCQIIEYTRRPPGDLYAIPVHRSTGINYADLIIRPYLGLLTETVQKYQATAFCSRHCLMAPHNGTFLDVEISDEIAPKIFEKITLKPPKHNIKNYLNERLAIFFIEYSSEIEMHEKTKQINKLIRAVVQTF